MSPSRRLFLAGGSLGLLAACTPDPTVHGGPAAPPAPPEPTQPPEVISLVNALSALVPVATAAGDPWGAAAAVQVGEWLARLRQVDPLADAKPHFPETSPSPAADLATALTRATEAARAAVDASQVQPERLLRQSILAGLTGFANQGAVPGATGVRPSSFPDVADDAAAQAAITRIWALQQGVEKGIGIVAKDDPLAATLLARRDEVRALRGKVLESFAANRPLQDAHYELPAITDATTAAAAWARLELAVLDALLVLAAVTRSWLEDALAQVAKVQASGGQLPTWPGWPARS